MSGSTSSVTWSARRLTARRMPMIVAIALLALVIAAPQLLSQYDLLQLALIAAFTAGAFGLLVLANSGQFNLGFAGLMAAGAYTTAVLQDHGVALVPALAAAGAMGLLAGGVLGVFAFWVGQFSMKIITFAFGIFIIEIIKQLEGTTGGLAGLSVPAAPITQTFLLSVLCAVIAGGLAWAMLYSWFGRSLRAVRDNPTAAELLGLPVGRVRFTAFLLTSPFAALTGGLYAQAIGFIAPSAFDVFLSLAFLIIVVVGGLSSLWGAVIGSVLWIVVPEQTASVHGLYPVLFGVLTVLVLIVNPGGLAAVPQAIRDVVDRQRAGRRTAALGAAGGEAVDSGSPSGHVDLRGE